MKNKKILYGLLSIGAIAGFYFWNKNKNPNDIRSKEAKDCANRLNHSYNPRTKDCLYNA